MFDNDSKIYFVLVIIIFTSHSLHPKRIKGQPELLEFTTVQSGSLSALEVTLLLLPLTLTLFVGMNAFILNCSEEVLVIAKDIKLQAFVHQKACNSEIIIEVCMRPMIYITHCLELHCQASKETFNPHFVPGNVFLLSAKVQGILIGVTW